MNEVALPEETEQLVQQSHDDIGGRVAVQQAGDPTQEAPEEVPRTLFGGDVEHDSIEVHDEPEQVEVERAELQLLAPYGYPALKR